MRVKCATCGRTRVPLLGICGIESYQSKTCGLEKPILNQRVLLNFNLEKHLCG